MYGTGGSHLVYFETEQAIEISFPFILSQPFRSETIYDEKVFVLLASKFVATEA